MPSTFPLPTFTPTFSARRFLLYTATFLTWLPALIVLKGNYGDIVPVTGPSMYPFLNRDYHASLRRRNWVLLAKLRPWEGVRRGSVVAFWSPTDPSKVVVKRVIALEGDEVSTRAPYPFPTERVPAGYVWVEGENADERQTRDSNTYGPISKNLIVGHLRAVVWPWSQVGWISARDWRGSERVRLGSGVDDGKVAEGYT